MTKEEIVLDVKRKLKFDIKGNNIRQEIQEAVINLTASFLICELPTGLIEKLNNNITLL